jgi:hypothetical protein
MKTVKIETGIGVGPRYTPSIKDLRSKHPRFEVLNGHFWG